MAKAGQNWSSKEHQAHKASHAPQVEMNNEPSAAWKAWSRGTEGKRPPEPDKYREKRKSPTKVEWR
jgi:hypothetical protein